MKRYDLRPLKDNFYDRMFELIKEDLSENENGIFLFEIGDFTPIQKVADLVKEHNYILMNSLKYNEVDWTVVIKKPPMPKEEEVQEEDSVTETEAPAETETDDTNKDEASEKDTKNDTQAQKEEVSE
jgi:NADH-quinone oxidoreductase subunit E